MNVTVREDSPMLHVPPPNCASCMTGKVGFCAGLAPEEVARIACVARPARYGRHQRIENRSEAPTTAVIVRQGTVKLTHMLLDGRNQIIDFLQSGDFAVRQASELHLPGEFLTATEADICEIGFADLERLCGESAQINRSVIGAALSQIERKNVQLLVLGRKRAGERLASFLLDMSQRAQRRGESAPEVMLPMSRAEIADYLGLTTETVSRAFSQLRSHRVISLPKPNFVRIRDLARLREISDGGAELPVR